MTTVDKSPPKHVFVSYSTSAEGFSKKLSARLRDCDIPVWVDRERLKLGTSNWQKAIRTAIAESIAVVVVASPGLSESVYVEAEIALAKKESRLVLPIWVTGAEWIDCIPMELIGHQYIDCRGDKYDAGVGQLVERLRAELREQQPRLFLTSHDHNYPGRFSIKLPNDMGVVSVYGPAYPSLQSLLDEFYMKFLVSRYPPRSYGKEWILRKGTYEEDWLHELIATWDWITKRGSMAALKEDWADSSLDSWRLRSGSSWSVFEEDLSSLFVYGLAVTDAHLFHMRPYDLAKRLLTAYYGETIGPVEQVDPAKIKVEEFPCSAILTCEPHHLAVLRRHHTDKYAAFVQKSYLTTPELIKNGDTH